MIIVTRITLCLLLGIAAYQVGASAPLSDWFRPPWLYVAWAGLVVVGVLLGYVLGGICGRLLRSRLKAIERAADRRSAAELTVGALGLVVGLVAAALAGLAVAQLPVVGPYLWIVVVLIVGYVFSRIAARRHVDILRLVGVRSRGTPASTRLIDTSAIIDGRLVDVVRTRFLSGSIVVPDFVLEELQRVADSTDPRKRARGRRGLELVEELKISSNGGFAVRTTGAGQNEPVDARLVRMARELGASIVTTDYNLNKVARLQEIEVLNVNDLANALKPAVLPGESMRVRVVREGKEYDQGVGYLDDGTMIVVDGAGKLTGQEIEVEVTSVLQNPSGKMIFSRLPDPGDPPHP